MSNSQIRTIARNKRNRWSFNVKKHVLAKIENWAELTASQRVKEFEEIFGTEGDLAELVRVSFALDQSAPVTMSDKSFVVSLVSITFEYTHSSD